jgi:hypothetical protein
MPRCFEPHAVRVDSKHRKALAPVKTSKIRYECFAQKRPPFGKYWGHMAEAANLLLLSLQCRERIECKAPGSEPWL